MNTDPFDLEFEEAPEETLFPETENLRGSGDYSDSQPPPIDPDHGSPESSEQARDSILIIGRAGSGKSVFLGRLYGALQMRSQRAMQEFGLELQADPSSIPHLEQLLQELETGRWPANTKGFTEVKLTARWEGGETDINYLDFPGEIFSRAFTSGREGPQEATLMESVERARHLLVLIDPQELISFKDQMLENVESPESRGKSATLDNTNGLAELLRFLRSTESGCSVPVTFLLTKADSRRALLAANLCRSVGSQNWSKDLFSKLLPSLISLVPSELRHTDWVSAVSEQRSTDHVSRPDIMSSPEHVIRAFKRAVHFDTLLMFREIRHSFTDDSRFPVEMRLASLKKMIGQAELLKLHPRHFPEVHQLHMWHKRMMRRVQGTGPGDKFAKIVDRYLDQQTFTRLR